MAVIYVRSGAVAVYVQIWMKHFSVSLFSVRTFLKHIKLWRHVTVPTLSLESCCCRCCLFKENNRQTISPPFELILWKGSGWGCSTPLKINIIHPDWFSGKRLFDWMSNCINSFVFYCFNGVRSRAPRSSHWPIAGHVISRFGNIP